MPLGAVLEKAEAEGRGRSRWCWSARTRATIADPATPGPIHFDRSLPLAKAKKDEVLLA